jgi:hypothetical protein
MSGKADDKKENECNVAPKIVQNKNQRKRNTPG